MDNYRIQAYTTSELWLKTSKLLLEEGDKEQNYEILNLVMVMENNPKPKMGDDKVEHECFENKFRTLFGDERIDYAKTITFLEPKPIHVNDTIDGDYEYSSAIEGKWIKTYSGRMWNWNGDFNQIEQSIKRIRDKKR